MALTEAKKLKGVVTTASPGPIPAAARASQRASVPEEQPMAWATPSWSAAARSNVGDRLAKDKLLRLQYMLEGLEQFLVERLVLALEVQHGHGLRSWSGLCGAGGLLARNMVAAVRGSALSRDEVHSRLPANGKFGGTRELKRLVNRYIVVTLRDLAAPGLPAPSPPICFFTQEQHDCTPTILKQKAGDRHMENKPAQNIQDTFLNTVRKDKTPITIYLVSGVKLTGKIRSFDKYSVLLENNSQEQLIFKHAISTVVSNRSVMHSEHRPARCTGMGPAAVPAPTPSPRQRGAAIGQGAPSLAVEGGAGGSSRLRRLNTRSLARTVPERAVLVGVDFTARRASHARRTRRRAPGGLAPETTIFQRIESNASEPAADLPGLDADESLAEFRELVRSAGGEVAAELMQRRARPDPATLVGAGKVEEIAGVAASTEADLVLFDHDLTPDATAQP